MRENLAIRGYLHRKKETLDLTEMVTQTDLGPSDSGCSVGGKRAQLERMEK